MNSKSISSAVIKYWILKPKGDQNDVIFGLKIGVGKGTCDETQLLLVFSSLRSLVT